MTLDELNDLFQRVHDNHEIKKYSLRFKIGQSQYMSGSFNISMIQDDGDLYTLVAPNIDEAKVKEYLDAIISEKLYEF